MLDLQAFFGTAVADERRSA